MKKIIFILFATMVLTSCSSLEDDAKKAAELNNKSIDYIKEQNLVKAEELYKESQEIIARYKESEQYMEFHRIYSDFLYKDSSNY